ncbi:related to UMP1-proteasome maturation factor [Serendipita indica DSM 11827]|uniref:Related to UMP1-proteasome maturation factor n=1 Tax=Serendipita indica (strain DSM 11827) TaxID=1109443 RepID=G4TRG2_SERID|nr:related to UMP1-proteasome maturation factor [Serendipita indica DSM 11827]
MSNSLKIVPTNDSSKVTLKDTANHHGLHDTLKYGPKSLASQHNNQLPIQSRLENWEQTQDDLKLNLYRNIYGLHAPVRMMMERKIVAQNPHFPAVQQSNVHLDILMGRDTTLDVGDFFGDDLGPQFTDIHGDMERARNIR